MTSSGPLASAGAALVEVTGIEKRFGTTRALRGVDLSLGTGQCLGLVGRNGAGKSTLVSILSGLAEPDAGEVRFGGKPAPRVGDIERWREWIATVFQHSMIVPHLSVAENVFLGSAPALVSWRAMRRRTSDIMRRVGVRHQRRKPRAGTFPSSSSRSSRSSGRWPAAPGASCLTSRPPPLSARRSCGCSTGSASSPRRGWRVLYISHHLEEVFEICQDVAVLRDGEMVLAAPTASLSRDDLVAAMVGSAHGRPTMAVGGSGQRPGPPAAPGTGGGSGGRPRRGPVR